MTADQPSSGGAGGAIAHAGATGGDNGPPSAVLKYVEDNLLVILIFNSLFKYFVNLFYSGFLSFIFEKLPLLLCPLSQLFLYLP